MCREHGNNSVYGGRCFHYDRRMINALKEYVKSIFPCLYVTLSDSPVILYRCSSRMKQPWRALERTGTWSWSSLKERMRGGSCRNDPVQAQQPAWRWQDHCIVPHIRQETPERGVPVSWEFWNGVDVGPGGTAIPYPVMAAQTPVQDGRRVAEDILMVLPILINWKLTMSFLQEFN